MRPVIFILLFILCGCSGDKLVDDRFQSFGTVVRIKAYIPEAAREVEQEAAEKVRGLDHIFDLYSPDSEISKVNSNAANAPYKVSDDLFNAISAGKELCAITKGALDIGIGAVEGEWGFYGDEGKGVPPSGDLTRTLSESGAGKILLDDRTRTVNFSDTVVRLDLNSIASGYACDRIAGILKARGVRSALVDMGGELYCLGRKGGKPWVIGIKDPLNTGDIIGSVSLTDMGIATSGGYEKFIVVDKKHYQHIVDPRTGRPVENGVLSVTVISKDCLTADGLGTAFLVLGPQRSYAIAKAAGADYIFVLKEADGVRVIVSEGARKVFTAGRKTGYNITYE